MRQNCKMPRSLETSQMVIPLLIYFLHTHTHLIVHLRIVKYSTWVFSPLLFEIKSYFLYLSRAKTSFFCVWDRYEVLGHFNSNRRGVLFLLIPFWRQKGWAVILSNENSIIKDGQWYLQTEHYPPSSSEINGQLPYYSLTAVVKSKLVHILNKSFLPETVSAVSCPFVPKM